MNTTQMREAVDEKLDLVDASMLVAINSILDAHLGASLDVLTKAEVVAYEVDGTPITEEVLSAQLVDIDRRIEEEEDFTIPAEDVFKEINQWLKPTA